MLRPFFVTAFLLTTPATANDGHIDTYGECATVFIVVENAQNTVRGSAVTIKGKSGTFSADGKAERNEVVNEAETTLASLDNYLAKIRAFCEKLP